MGSRPAPKNVPKKKQRKQKAPIQGQQIDYKLEEKLKKLSIADLPASSLDLIGEDGSVLHFDLKKYGKVHAANMLVIRSTPKQTTIDDLKERIRKDKDQCDVFDRLAENFEKEVKIGEYANHVGAYYWDTEREKLACHAQDNSFVEEDFNILFSDTLSKGAGYIPRLICLEQKNYRFASCRPAKEDGHERGNFPSYKGIETTFAHSWAGSVERITPDKLYITDPCGPSQDHETSAPERQEAPRQCGYPHSLCELPSKDGYNLESGCSYFSQGYELAQECNSWLIDEVMDKKIRRFAEDSDCLQGFQVFGDLGKAIPGVTTVLIKEIRDQYPKCAILNVGLKQPPAAPAAHGAGSDSRKAHNMRKADEALFVGSLLGEKALTVFLKQPNGHPPESSNYDAGKLFGAFDNTRIFAPASEESLSLGGLFNVVTGGEQRWFSSVSASVPVEYDHLSYINTSNITSYIKPFGPHRSTPLSELYGSMLISRGVVRQLLDSTSGDNDATRVCLSDEYIRKENSKIHSLSYLFMNSLPYSTAVKSVSAETVDSPTERMKSIVCLSSGRNDSRYLTEILGSLNARNILDYSQATFLPASRLFDTWECIRVNVEDMMDLYM